MEGLVDGDDGEDLNAFVFSLVSPSLYYLISLEVCFTSFGQTERLRVHGVSSNVLPKIRRLRREKKH